MEITISTKCPDTPNFIRTTREELIPIADLTERQLREIGREWTEELVKKAVARREQAASNN